MGSGRSEGVGFRQLECQNDIRADLHCTQTDAMRNILTADFTAFDTVCQGGRRQPVHAKRSLQCFISAHTFRLSGSYVKDA